MKKRKQNDVKDKVELKGNDIGLPDKKKKKYISPVIINNDNNDINTAKLKEKAMQQVLTLLIFRI